MGNEEISNKLDQTINLLLDKCIESKDTLLIEVTATFINATVNYQAKND